DRAWRDGIDGNAVGGEFERPGFGTPDQRAFGRRVAGSVDTAMGHAAADIDDTAFLARLHRRDEGLRDLDSDPDIQIEYLIERSQIDFAQWFGLNNAHIVHHGIHRILFAYDAQNVFCFTRIVQIAGVQVARKINVLGMASQTHHVATQIGQALADRPAYAFGGS